MVGLLFSTCIADPWPEPDEAAPRASGGGSPNDDADDGTDADGWEPDTAAPPHNTDGDTAVEDDVPLSPRLDQVYSSASGIEGTVTVVGLAGTVLQYDDVIIRRGDDFYGVTIGQDGGFARQVPGLAGETLEVIVHNGTRETSTTITVVGNTLDNIEAEIAGIGLTVDSVGSNVIIHGDGGALRNGDLVIGANRSQSTGGVAVISCNDGGCLFDLLIPGQSGDQIELFLVAADERAGYSDVYNLTI